MEGILHTTDYQRFTVVAPDGATAEFEGAARAGRALPGDTVSWDGSFCQTVVRHPAPLFLVGTVELTSKTRYGMSSRGVPIFRFTPMSEAYPPFFVGCSQRDTRWNLLGRIQFDSWSADSSLPKGVLVQTFGAAGNLEAEEAALLAHYGAARWKRGEASGCLSPGEASDQSLLDAATFHIDPPGCRDIDDAVTLCELPGDEMDVHIHIADVASWLIANPHLVEKATAIGQTLYRDGAAVRPMFPLELSEGTFSLLPGESRRALTLTARVDLNRGVLVGEPRWAFHQICVKESHTYESAATASWAATLAQVAQALNGGKVSADPHDWVESLMLFYNRSAAAALRARGQGVLRRHAAPDLQRMAQLRELSLPAEKLAMRAGEYCSPAAADVVHWGLGAAAYCHASSPIRRWADCVNQLALRDWILGTSDAWKADATALNVAAKRAKQYERDLIFLRALVGPDAQKKVVGIVVEDGHLWIDAWGRLARADTKGLEPGARVRVWAFADESQRNWKRRLVLRVEL